MGGIPDKPAPVLSPAQIRARLIELGKQPTPKILTVYMVEDPSFPLSFPSRTVADNCFQAIPIGHFEIFKFSVLRMEKLHAAFYRDREAAWQDAAERAGTKAELAAWQK